MRCVAAVPRGVLDIAKVDMQGSTSKTKILNLMPGMLLLKNWLDKKQQVDIVETCLKLGNGEGGFFKPTFPGGNEMGLWMMCLGKNWNHRSYCYEERRSSSDNAMPPPIPPSFISLVEGAIQEAHSELRHGDLRRRLTNAEIQSILPSMVPDVCIVNFYDEWGKLGLHQDKDESPLSLERGIPVVSFSVGDSAEFVYAASRYMDPHKIVLDSGDVLIFGGDARSVFHGISRLNPNTAPAWLIQHTRIHGGRFNLTFRQI